jgi:hypothetical protein
MSRKLIITLYSYLIALLLSFGCAARKPVAIQIQEAKILAQPILVRRPVDPVLDKFGKMTRVYIASLEERPIEIDIDLLPNETGIEKELPYDIGPYVRNAVEKIGKPFVTIRTNWDLLKNPAGSVLGLQQDRPKPPPADFKIVGSLQRASECLVEGDDKRIDALAGNGSGQLNASATKEGRRTETCLTLTLNLEGRNGQAVRGAQAVYKMTVDKTELNRSVSIYIGGSGMGGGRKVTVTQDLGDALSDAAAAAVIHVLGNALMVPFYRCDEFFFPDETLDERAREAFSRLTRAELEQNVKRYLFVDGYQTSWPNPSFTDGDRAIAVLEMRRRSLEFADREALVEFAFQLWKEIDYVKAATRVDNVVTRYVHETRQRAEDEAVREAREGISPTKFGWPASAKIVVLDLTNVKAIEVRKKIVAAARACKGCDEIVADASVSIVGIRVSSEASEVQLALRRSGLALRYVWDNRQQRLRLAAD